MTPRSGEFASDGAGAPAVRRATAILLELASHPEGLSVTELARRLRLPKSSASDVCAALLEERLLSREPEGRFGLGLGVVELAHAFVGGTRLIELFLEETVALPGVEDETVLLSVLDGGNVAYLCSREGTAPLPLSFRPGSRLPAWGTASGRVLLAALGPPPVGELARLIAAAVPSLPEAPPEAATLHAELKRVRERGYAVDEGGAAPGMAAVAAPVVAPGWGAVGAVSVPLLTHGLEGRRRGAVIAAVRALGETLSERLAADTPA